MYNFAAELATFEHLPSAAGFHSATFPVRFPFVAYPNYYWRLGRLDRRPRPHPSSLGRQLFDYHETRKTEADLPISLKSGDSDSALRFKTNKVFSIQMHTKVFK